MIYPLVRDLAVDGIPVTVACRVLGFSTQGLNKWRRNPISQRDWDDAHLTNLALDIHRDDPEFGYRFVSDEIADHGVTASERRVWRLCSEQKLWSLHAKAGPHPEGRAPGSRRPRVAAVHSGPHQPAVAHGYH